MMKMGKFKRKQIFAVERMIYNVEVDQRSIGFINVYTALVGHVYFQNFDLIKIHNRANNI